MASTAPSDAEALTPISPGSASGLRRYPCSAAPERPSVAPIISPSSARGRRTSLMISAIASDLSENSAAMLSPKAIAAGPTVSESRNSASVAAANADTVRW